MIFTFCRLSFSFLTLLFDAVFEYRNEAYFNGQCFHICQGKVYVKRTSSKRCVNMRKCRFINQMKFKDYFAHICCVQVHFVHVKKRFRA